MNRTSNGYGEWMVPDQLAPFLARVRGRSERVIKRTERDAEGVYFDVRLQDPDVKHPREEDEDTRVIWSCRIDFQSGKPAPTYGIMEASLEQERIADEIAERYLVGAIS